MAINWIRRAQKALTLAEKGLTMTEATRAARCYNEIRPLAIQARAGQAPAWIYERYAAIMAHPCDLCGEILLPTEWLSRLDRYGGIVMRMYFCSEECRGEWDALDLDAEEGLPAGDVLGGTGSQTRRPEEV